MTKSEAKRYVCRVAAALLSEADNQEWPGQSPDDPTVELSEADRERVLAAARELADELLRRGK